MVTRTILVQNQNDFKNQILNSLTYVSSSTPSVNQFTWDNTNKCVVVNANRGSFRIPLGACNIGDNITVECELYSISGVLPHVSLDFSETSYEYSGWGTTDVQSIRRQGTWEQFKMTFSCQWVSDYTSCIIGLSTGKVGQYRLRNVRISIDSTRNMTQISDSYVIKHDNGVMEQFFKVRFTNIDIDSPWGSMFGTTVDYTIPNFPETFWNDNVIVTTTTFGDMGTGYPLSILASTRSAPNRRNMGTVTFFRGASSTDLTVEVHVHAIGRWR